MEKLIHKANGKLVLDAPFYCTKGAKVRLIVRDDYTGSRFPIGTEGVVSEDDAIANKERIEYEKRSKDSRRYVMAHWTGHYETWMPLEYIQEVP